MRLTRRLVISVLAAGSSIPAEIAVPPSGYVAGIYARNDELKGVAKAPANEVVLGASRFERNINFAEQALLNPLGINCLRYFPNRGYRVWGADISPEGSSSSAPAVRSGTTSSSEAGPPTGYSARRPPSTPARGRHC